MNTNFLTFLRNFITIVIFLDCVFNSCKCSDDVCTHLIICIFCSDDTYDVGNLM